MAAPPPTVLVVDDVAWVRNVLSASLPRYGFTVLPAENGQQALDLCRRTDAVRVAVIDKGLPDMDGLELLAALRQLNPEIHCALMSGDAPLAAEELPGLGWVHVFRKPFSLVEVAQGLWQLLGEEGPPVV